jgi:hypothetical protein
MTKDLLESFLQITLSHQTIASKIKEKWIGAETLTEAIGTANRTHGSLNLTPRILNRLLPKIAKYANIQHFDGQNQSGLFKLEYSKKKYYYIVQPGVQITYPLLDKAGGASAFLKKVETDSKNITFRSNRENSIPLHVPQEEARQAISNQQPERVSELPQSKRQKLLKETYWDSPEAQKLFNPSQDDVNSRETLQRRIKQLCLVQQGTDGWRHAVLGRDPDNICTENDKVVLRQKSLLLCQSYQIALREFEKAPSERKNWVECCTEACTILNPLGINQTIRGEHVQRYNRLFRNLNAFPHPNMDVRAGRMQALPSMLRSFQSIREGIQRYAVANLVGLTVD